MLVIPGRFITIVEKRELVDTCSVYEGDAPLDWFHSSLGVWFDTVELDTGNFNVGTDGTAPALTVKVLEVPLI